MGPPMKAGLRLAAMMKGVSPLVATVAVGKMATAVVCNANHAGVFT